MHTFTTWTLWRGVCDRVFVSTAQKWVLHPSCRPFLSKSRALWGLSKDSVGRGCFEFFFPPLDCSWKVCVCEIWLSWTPVSGFSSAVTEWKMQVYHPTPPHPTFPVHNTVGATGFISNVTKTSVSLDFALKLVKRQHGQIRVWQRAEHLCWLFHKLTSVLMLLVVRTALEASKKGTRFFLCAHTVGKMQQHALPSLSSDGQAVQMLNALLGPHFEYHTSCREKCRKETTLLALLFFNVYLPISRFVVQFGLYIFLC